MHVRVCVRVAGWRAARPVPRAGGRAGRCVGQGGARISSCACGPRCPSQGTERKTRLLLWPPNSPLGPRSERQIHEGDACRCVEPKLCAARGLPKAVRAGGTREPGALTPALVKTGQPGGAEVGGGAPWPGGTRQGPFPQGPVCDGDEDAPLLLPARGGQAPSGEGRTTRHGGARKVPTPPHPPLPRCGVRGWHAPDPVTGVRAEWGDARMAGACRGCEGGLAARDTAGRSGRRAVSTQPLTPTLPACLPSAGPALGRFYLLAGVVAHFRLQNVPETQHD